MLDTPKKIGLLATAFTLIFVSFVSTNSFGEELPSDYAIWQLVYLTNEHKCFVPDGQKLTKYSEFVSKYFELYEFDNYAFEPKCLNALEYPNYNPPYVVDLVILVLDSEYRKNILTSHGYDGLYAHFGENKMNNHVIMISEPGEFDSAFESTTVSWNASHQLSHFILSFIGYDSFSIERLLHSNQLSVNDCVAKNFKEKRCDSFRSFIKSDLTGKKFAVMAPLKNLIGKNIETYISKDVITSKVILNLHREITTWWLDGIIDDNSYLAATRHIIDVPKTEDSSFSNSVMILQNGFIILDEAPDDTIEWQAGKFNAFAEMNTDIQEILDYIPFSTEHLTFEEKSSEIPSWFKVRAKNWSEGKLGDRIFYDGLKALISE